MVFFAVTADAVNARRSFPHNSGIPRRLDDFGSGFIDLIRRGEMRNKPDIAKNVVLDQLDIKKNSFINSDYLFLLN